MLAPQEVFKLDVEPCKSNSNSVAESRTCLLWHVTAGSSTFKTVTRADTKAAWQQAFRAELLSLGPDLTEQTAGDVEAAVEAVQQEAFSRDPPLAGVKYTISSVGGTASISVPGLKQTCDVQVLQVPGTNLDVQVSVVGGRPGSLAVCAKHSAAGHAADGQEQQQLVKATAHVWLKAALLAQMRADASG